MKLVLLGEPQSTNHLYKSHCRFGHPCVYMTKEGKALKESYQWQAISQYKKPPLKGDIKLGIVLFFGTKRKCDWDNFHKISQDALTGIVWNDDSQIVKVEVEKKYDKQTPRIEIEVVHTIHSH